jgi:hypothetical protein
MSVLNSLARLLSIFGFALLILSVVTPAVAWPGAFMAPDVIEGECFLVTDDMYMDIRSEGEKNFSCTLLGYEDITQFLESGSMEGLHPILHLENISEYEGAIHFPGPGVYGLFLYHTNNESIIIRCIMMGMRMSFIYPGLVLVSPLVITLAWGLVQKKRERLPEEAAAETQ